MESCVAEIGFQFFELSRGAGEFGSTAFSDDRWKLVLTRFNSENVGFYEI